MSSNHTPYADLPDAAFWRRAVAAPPPSEVDPAIGAAFQLTRNDRVATAGSCFAVHLSRHLANSGFNYFVTEPNHPLLGPMGAEFGFGTFSARYGNIYTSRQLLQLFDRAYGTFQPEEDVWPDGRGRYYDPFRPNIQPDGFASETEYWADRAGHFAAVRQLFEDLDVLVFTLGLTEGWLSKVDGAAFTICPGVSAGTFDPDRHVFHNLSCDEVIADLDAFIRKLRGVNPNARVILTVSPVPLIATMEPRHVLVSSTFSKSALRVACDAIVRRFSGVAYFPSYEVVTATFTRGRYFADDLRSVTGDGVAHVMRLFFKHYGDTGVADESNAAHEPQVHPRPDRVSLSEQINQALCDEELLDAGV